MTRLLTQNVSILFLKHGEIKIGLLIIPVYKIHFEMESEVEIMLKILLNTKC